MKEISAEMRVLYDAQLVQKKIQKKSRFYYTKWLRYYLVSIHKGLFSAIFVSIRRRRIKLRVSLCGPAESGIRLRVSPGRDFP